MLINEHEQQSKLQELNTSDNAQQHLSKMLIAIRSRRVVAASDASMNGEVLTTN